MPERNEKMLKQLKSNYEMYERTKKETEKNMRRAENPDGTKRFTEEKIKENLALISEAEKDIIEQFKNFGGTMEELTGKQQEVRIEITPNRVEPTPAIKKEDIDNETLMKAKASLEEAERQRKEIIESQESATATRLEQTYIPPKDTYSREEAFDVIPLPSKGEAYKEKIAKVSVAYLTAYDENMIVSPNLYRDNLILDYIINEKLLSKEIDPMDLLEGDREAILLFLRATGYGNEYPITATDAATGKDFDTIIDLSKLEYKDFKLKGDSNGWFPFTLPVSKKEIKFRFPTHRDTVLLEKMQEAEEPRIMKETISNYVETLDKYIDDEKELPKDQKVKVRQAIATITKWGEDMPSENSLKFNHALTNRLNLLIMAVDGITDKKYIADFVRTMNVRDSSALRKYMTQNEPGVNYNITINRPEELGGGSMTTFLQFDKFLFLNIT